MKKLTESQIQELYNYTKKGASVDLDREDFDIFIEKAYKTYKKSNDIYSDIKKSIDNVLNKLNEEE